MAVSGATSPPGRAPAEDPQADRVVLLPTAYTHPKGTFYLTSYDVVLLQGGYAFTDDTQVSVTALPIATESFTVLDFSLKTVLVRSGLVRVAAIGSVSGGVGKDIGVQFVGRVGGVGQLCLDRRCDSSFSLSSNLTLVGAPIMANGVGGIWRVGRTVSLLAELATLVPLSGSALAEFNGAALGGGVRFHLVHWGFDIALIRALNSAGSVAPLLTATYRSSP